jgi:hypothetical protein
MFLGGPIIFNDRGICFSPECWLGVTVKTYDFQGHICSHELSIILFIGMG